MKKLQNLAMALACAGTLATAVPVSAAVPMQAQAAHADEWNHGRRHHRDWDERYERYDRDDRYGRYDRSGYRDSGYYSEPVRRDTRTWRGDDGRWYCRRDNGTTGLIVGGAVGGLIGNEVAGRGGDRTLGVILGAAGGALLGREIDRGGSRCH